MYPSAPPPLLPVHPTHIDFGLQLIGHLPCRHNAASGQNRFCEPRIVAQSIAEWWVTNRMLSLFCFYRVLVVVTGRSVPSLGSALCAHSVCIEPRCAVCPSGPDHHLCRRLYTSPLVVIPHGLVQADVQCHRGCPRVASSGS